MARNVPSGSDRKLKLAQHLKLASVDGDVVTEAIKGTAAADVQLGMPPKPRAIADDDEFSEVWDAIVPELYAAKLCSRIDWPILEMLVRHFVAARDASDDLNLGESTVWDEKNDRPMKNPAEVVFRSESMAFMAYAKEMGMTFASRAAAPGRRSGTTPPAGGEDENPFLTGTDG